MQAWTQPFVGNDLVTSALSFAVQRLRRCTLGKTSCKLVWNTVNKNIGESLRLLINLPTLSDWKLRAGWSPPAPLLLVHPRVWGHVVCSVHRRSGHLVVLNHLPVLNPGSAQRSWMKGKNVLKGQLCFGRKFLVERKWLAKTTVCFFRILTNSIWNW